MTLLPEKLHSTLKNIASKNARELPATHIVALVECELIAVKNDGSWAVTANGMEY